MRNEVLLAIISKLVDDKIKQQIALVEPVPGPKGRDGKDGYDFRFEEYQDTIKLWVKEYALKFSDLTIEEIETLRGPKGERGDSFSFEDSREAIEKIINTEIALIQDSLKLKFTDLTEDEKAELKGPRGQRGKSGQDGRDGRDGKDFIFDEHKEFFQTLKLKFSDLTAEELDQLKLKFSHISAEDRDSLKLKFSDLTVDEIEAIRGPKGKDGKNFIFEEHREFFETLRPTFSDFSIEEVNKLKLKFTDLTEDEKAELKGPRGQRGKPGRDGADGLSIMGPPGISGANGRDGRNGLDGKDGIDGESAPVIERIELKKEGTQVHLEFEMSDGEIKKTNNISITNNTSIIAFGTGSGGGSGSSFDPDTILTGPTQCLYAGPVAPLEVLIDNNGNVLIGV